MAAVCVFCASSTRIDAGHVQLAAELGAELARRGHSLVSGGGSISSMGAVASAARDGGAHTVGVIPRELAGTEIADRNADELLITETMRERKAEMDRRSDAFLALPGGIGTLEELLEVWTARTLGMHDKPVVVLDPDGTFDLLRDQIDALAEAGFVRPSALRALRWTGSVGEALDAIEAELAELDEFAGTNAVPVGAPASAAEMLEAEL